VGIRAESPKLKAESKYKNTAASNTKAPGHKFVLAAWGFGFRP